MRAIMDEGDMMSTIVPETRNGKAAMTRGKFVSLLRYFLFLFALYLFFTFGIGVIQVSGYSMEPSLKDGSFLLTNKFASNYKNASFGDVVVIKEELKEFFIVKRVIGVPGDTISIKNGKVFVNDLSLPEVYALGVPNDMDPVTVPQDHIFVLGDNRTPGESLDSRDSSIGPIPNSSVKGYPLVSLFPFYKIAGPLDL